MKVFLNNLDIINKQNEKFNNGTATYFMDINSMSDMVNLCLLFYFISNI